MSARRTSGGPPRPRPTPGPRDAGRAIDVAAEIARLDRLAELLDSRFRVPGLGWRFGLDSVVGLIPGVGDLAALGPSAYLVWQARRLGADKRTIAKMAANTGVDFVVGSVPILGDVFDAAYKANLRNIDLLKRDLTARGGRAPPRR